MKTTVKAIWIAAFLITGLTAIHYRNQAIEARQDFTQAIAEFDRLREEGCKDEVDTAIQKVGDEMLKACEDKIDQLTKHK